MKTIHWGILGTGRIARKFAADLKYAEDCVLIATGSSGKESAAKFHQEFPVKYSHESYLALVQNPEVDVIYVATPRSHHPEHVLLCLKHNKAVLCEKAFALNSRQAIEMINAARERKVF